MYPPPKFTISSRRWPLRMCTIRRSLRPNEIPRIFRGSSNFITLPCISVPFFLYRARQKMSARISPTSWPSGVAFSAVRYFHACSYVFFLSGVDTVVEGSLGCIRKLLCIIYGEKVGSSTRVNEASERLRRCFLLADSFRARIIISFV